MDQAEKICERYQYLFAPAKSLADNYDIDIVALLEQFISNELEESRIDQIGQRKMFNFSEAAMIIDSTTCVYGKKVDFVHQIAYNFFDQLKDRKEKMRKEHKDDDDNNQNNESLSDENKCKRSRQQFNLNYSALKNVVQKLLSDAPVLPDVPISFIPVTECEKSNVQLFAKTNLNDAIGKKDDFHVNTCYIYESVALLDLKNMELVDRFSEIIFKDANQTMEKSYIADAIDNASDDESRTPIPPLTLNLNNSINSEKMEKLTDENADLDLNGSCIDGFLNHDDDDDFDIGILEQMEVDRQSIHQQTDSNVDTNGVIRASSVLTTATQPIAVLAPNELLQETNEALNFPQTTLSTQNSTNQIERTISLEQQHNESNWQQEFEQLDLLLVYREKHIPFKMNKKCITNPRTQIKSRDKRIADQCARKNIPDFPSVKSYVDSHMYKRKPKKRANEIVDADSFLTGDAVLCLNNLVIEERKRRAEIQKNRHKAKQNELRAARLQKRQTVDPIMDYPTEDNEIADNHNDGDQYVNADVELRDPYDNDDLNNDIEVMFDDDDENDQRLDNVLDINDLENTLGVNNLYNDFSHFTFGRNGKRRSIKLTRNLYDDTVLMEGDTNPDDLPSRPISQMDYDEIIKYHLRRYWASTEQNLPAVYEKLQKWEEKIIPLLQAEQEQREFDTKIYSNDLLKQFDGKISAEVNLSKVLEDRPKYEVSRYLLVSLIMTNVGNFEIIPGENSFEMPTLKLLKLDLYSDVLDMEQRIITGQNL